MNQIPGSLEETARRLVVDFCTTAQSQFQPLLHHHLEFEKSLSTVTHDEGGEHLHYHFDQVAHEILVEAVERNQIDAHVFSEETGWFTVGARPALTVVCDPFDNSSLAARSFRDSSVAISVADESCQFLASAIADLSSSSIFYADTTGARIIYPSGPDAVRSSTVMHTSSVTKLKDAFVAVSSVKQSRRRALAKSQILTEPKLFHSLDGAIFIARLAAGYIDAYLDPYKGQPLYEIPCLEIVRRAGGFVSDLQGNMFEFTHIIKRIQKEPSERYLMVAASTEELHDEVLRSI